MSSSTSKKQARTERARIVAEMRAVEARKEQRRRLALAGAAVVAVLIVVGALVGIGLSKSGGSDTSAGSSTASASVVKGVTSVPASTLDAVGAGAKSIVAPAKITAPPLTKDGKPQVLYVGAEYCPFCAAERWPVVVALSRFGTWSGLGTTTSSSQDQYPNTPTLTFHGASYKSDYLSFTGVEQQDRAGKPLDKPSAADAKIEATYNKPPYVPTQGSIPFVDIGGKFASQGASFGPDLLAGKTHEQIASALSDPSSPIAKAVDASANALTASVCTLTGNKPANVCTSSGVTAAASRITG